MVHTRCELFSVFRRVTLASRASYRYLAVAKYDLYVGAVACVKRAPHEEEGFLLPFHPSLALIIRSRRSLRCTDGSWWIIIKRGSSLMNGGRVHATNFRFQGEDFFSTSVWKKKKESFEGANKFEKYKFGHDLKGLKGRLIQIFSKFSDGRNTSSSSESFFEIDSSSQRITRRRD